MAASCYFQAFEVASKLWLAAYTSKEGLNPGADHQTQENDFIVIYGGLGLCQALAYLAAVLQVYSGNVGTLLIYKSPLKIGIQILISFPT